MIAAQENAKLAVPSNPQDWAGRQKGATHDRFLSGWPGLPVTALFRTVA